MSRARFLYSALAVTLLVGAAIFVVQTLPQSGPPTTKVAPASNEEAIAQDLIVSCVPEAAAFVRSPFSQSGRTADYEHLRDAEAKEVVVRLALEEAIMKRPSSSPTPDDLMSDARQERAKSGTGPTAEAFYTYRACIALRNSDIQAGSPLRTERPMSNGVALASKLPPMQAGVSSSKVDGLQPEAPDAGPQKSQADDLR